MNDPLRSNLDNAVSSRLSEHSKFCDSLSAKVKLLEDSIYEEAVLIFGHPLTKEIKLSGKSRRTIQSIKLINQKNLLVAQISSASNPSQHAALQELLSPTKEKIRVMRRAERRCRKRLIFKKGQAAFSLDHSFEKSRFFHHMDSL